MEEKKEKETEEGRRRRRRRRVIDEADSNGRSLTIEEKYCCVHLSTIILTSAILL
jgi:hypothetical protein